MTLSITAFADRGPCNRNVRRVGAGDGGRINRGRWTFCLNHASRATSSPWAEELRFRALNSRLYSRADLSVQMRDSPPCSAGPGCGRSLSEVPALAVAPAQRNEHRGTGSTDDRIEPPPRRRTPSRARAPPPSRGTTKHQRTARRSAGRTASRTHRGHPTTGDATVAPRPIRPRAPAGKGRPCSLPSVSDLVPRGAALSARQDFVDTQAGVH
jgi:hypothetical protein